MDFKNKKITKNSRLCQDYFKMASSALTQLKFNSIQTNSELGTTQLKLVFILIVVVVVIVDP